jgi:hypothetical protein
MISTSAPPALHARDFSRGWQQGLTRRAVQLAQLWQLRRVLHLLGLAVWHRPEVRGPQSLKEAPGSIFMMPNAFVYARLIIAPATSNCSLPQYTLCKNNAVPSTAVGHPVRAPRRDAARTPCGGGSVSGLYRVSRFLKTARRQYCPFA